MKASASAPTRSSSTIMVAWGLVNLELGLYASTEETRVARKEFTADGNPVGRQMVDKVTGEPVDYATIVKMVEVGPGVAVPLSDEEMAAVTGTLDGTAPVVDLIDLISIGREFMPDKLYQVRPKANKKGASGSAKAFALLTRALAERDQAALVRVTLRGNVARYAALTPDGYLITLHYTDGVREALPMPVVEVSDAELQMAHKLLDAIVGSEAPLMLTDTNSAKIAEYIEAKAFGGAVVEPKVAEASAPVDIMSQLMASIVASKSA